MQLHNIYVVEAISVSKCEKQICYR